MYDNLDAHIKSLMKSGKLKYDRDENVSIGKHHFS